MTVIEQILDTLNLVTDNGKVVEAGKYFIAKRVLEIAYEKINKEGLDSRSITPYITAILDYRSGRSEIEIIKDKQTNEYEVYWYRLKEGKPHAAQTIDPDTNGSEKKE